MKKILHLTLKKKWFDMILSGEKTEEYRERKLYWRNRLFDKKFDIVRFTNGYGKDKPSFDIEAKDIFTTCGIIKWGAEPRVIYYTISLGKILETRNIKPKE